MMTHNYTFKWTIPIALLKQYEKFISGDLIKDGQSLSVGQYVIFNLRGVRLQYVHPNSAKNLTVDDGFVSTIGRIAQGVVDTVAMRIPPRERDIGVVHVSPSFKTESIYITTCVGFENDSETSVVTVGGLGLTIWLLTSLTICILSIITYLIHKYQGRRVTLLDCLWFYVSSMLLNVSKTDNGLSTQLILSGWLFGSFVIMTLYSGNLNSQLLIGKSKFVDNIDDILVNKKLKPMIDPGSPFQKFLMAQWPGRPKKFDELLARHFRNPEVIHRKPELLGEFLEGKLAVFQDDRYVNYIFEQIIDKLRKTGKQLYFGKEKYNSMFYTMMFNKNVPRSVLENADYLLTRYAETAQWVVIDRHRIFRQRPFVVHKSYTRSVKPLQTVNLKRVLNIWLYGLVLSITYHVTVLIYLMLKSLT